MSTAIIITCHQVPHYWLAQAKANPNCRFYLHYDAKFDIEELLTAASDLPNVKILVERKAIHWAGFSLVEATLLLMREALADPENQYFHYVSGNCVALHDLAEIERQFQTFPADSLFLECYEEIYRRYRLRFDTPHADTVWQRRLSGKILTKCYQLADRLIPFKEPFPTGINWFSAGRVALEWLEVVTDQTVQDFFRHKLCPDEHFFQYILTQHPEAPVTHYKQNQRYIFFKSVRSNHPDNLDRATLETLAGQDRYWFARKVTEETAMDWLNLHVEIWPEGGEKR